MPFLNSFIPRRFTQNFSLINISGGQYRQGFLTLLDQGIFSLGNFFTSVVIGRYCAREDLGLYLLAFTIIYFLMDAQNALITTPYTIFIPRKSESGKRVFTGNTLLLQLILALFISLLILLFLLLVPSRILPDGLAGIMLGLTAVCTFILLREYTRRAFFARLEMKKALLLDVTITVLQVLLLLGLLYLHWLSATSAIVVIGGVSGVVTFLWLYHDRREIAFDSHQLKQDLMQCYQAGKWVFASGFLWNLVTYLYPWLLTSFQGAAVTGTWAACLGIIALCNPLYLGLQNYFTPRIAHAYATQSKNSLRNFTVKSTLVFLGLLGLCSIVLAISGDFFLVLLYGEKYGGNGIIIILLSLNLLLVAGGFSLSRAIFTIERAEVDFKINLVTLLVFFTLGVWAIHNLGIFGAALGLVTGNFVALILRSSAFLTLLKQ